MTKCIAIDTSTKRFCLGAKNSSDYFDLSIEQSTDHAKEIFKRIDDVLKLASVSLKELDFLEAVITASAMASFAVEGSGIFSIANATKSALDHRINVIKNKMNINQV